MSAEPPSSRRPESEKEDQGRAREWSRLSQLVFEFLGYLAALGYAGWLLDELSVLVHRNGKSLVHVYGPLNTQQRGGTVTFNLFDPQGRFIDHRQVEHRANQVNISLRTGCFCNPGGGELALGISAKELESCFVRSKERLTFDDFRRCIDDKSTGAVRVSVGLATTFEDVYRFVQFISRFVDKKLDHNN